MVGQNFQSTADPLSWGGVRHGRVCFTPFFCILAWMINLRGFEQFSLGFSTRFLEVSIRIEYMDRTVGPVGGYHHDFIVKEKPPQLYFLYRPGHYDILYPRQVA